MDKSITSQRIKNYLSFIKDSKGVLYIDNSNEIFYILGVNVSYGALLIDSTGKLFFFTDPRYFELIKRDLKIEDLVCIEVKGNLYNKIFEFCKAYNYKELYLNKNELKLSTFDHLKKGLKENDLKDVLISYDASVLRKVKDKNEISYIHEATKISHLALKELRHNIYYGDSEVVISNKLISLMYKYGATGIAFPPIVAIDDRSAFPHSTPSEESKISVDSKILLIDFGCSYKGYCTDITRVFAIDSIDSECQKIYNIVYNTQQKTIEKLIDDKTIECNKLSKIAEDHLGDYPLIHSLGHGIGLEVHEMPYINKFSKDKLQDGTAFTIEPGIYLPGKFGIRIEDTYIYKGGMLLNNLYADDKFKVIHTKSKAY